MNNNKSALTISILLLVNALLLGGCAWTDLDKSVGAGKNLVDDNLVNSQLSPTDAKSYIEGLSAENITDNVIGVILPHHLLVASFMDKFYQQLTAKLKEEKREISRVILISPNHFGYGYNFIQSTDEANAKDFAVKLDMADISALKRAGVLAIEPKYFPREHGVTTHFSFLDKYFPKAKVIPVILKRDTPQEKLDALVRELVTLDGQTLVIASIDFSHYSAEESSLQNDGRMVAWLSALGNCDGKAAVNCRSKNFSDVEALHVSKDISVQDAVGVDSPEAIYVMNNLMRGLGAKNFQLWRRTSSASLLGGSRPEDNTSHLFGSYGRNQ